VLGPANDKALLDDQAAQPVAADADPGNLPQVRGQPGNAPDGMDVAVGQGRPTQCPPQLLAVLGRDPRRPARARPIRQRTQPALLPASTDVADGVEAQAGGLGDSAGRLSGRRQQEADGPLADAWRGGLIPQLSQSPPFPCLPFNL